MYHADLAGLLAARWAGRPPVIWNVRHSHLGPGTRPATRAVARACALLTRGPRRIVVGSEAARRAHAALGYDAGRMVVILNGFDVDVLRPDPAGRAAVRGELGIPDGALVVGTAARAHPDKDHDTLLAALDRVAGEDPRVHPVLCGDGVADGTPLGDRVRARAWGGRARLLGMRPDVGRLMAGWDVAVCSSRTEGFPNAVGEAMACGVPCVTTDVGDAAALVGDTGVVVPPRRPAALAEGMRSVLALDAAARAGLGRRARARIVEEFSLQRMVAQYHDLYRGVLAPAEGRPAAAGRETADV
jgi:glycosyltransferase involved in cell wall biosynthesis